MSEDRSTLLIHADEPPKRRGHLHKAPCPWSDPDPADRFAPSPCNCKCVDIQGFRRKRHSWDRDGVCHFCSRRLRWEAL